MNKKKFFYNGKSVEWVDRETLKYSNGGFSALIWVDVEPGFFPNGKIIKSSTIKNWKTVPEGYPELITDCEKQEIIKTIQEYYKSVNKKCRVE
jgi:hypothetical protein